MSDGSWAEWLRSLREKWNKINEQFRAEQRAERERLRLQWPADNPDFDFWFPDFDSKMETSNTPSNARTRSLEPSWDIYARTRERKDDGVRVDYTNSDDGYDTLPDETEDYDTTWSNTTSRSGHANPFRMQKLINLGIGDPSIKQYDEPTDNVARVSTTYIAINLSSTAGPVNFTSLADIAQGNGDAQRTGTDVNFIGMSLRIFLVPQDNMSYNLARVFVIWVMKPGPTYPVAAYCENGNVYSHTGRNQEERLVALFDKTWAMNMRSSHAGTVEGSANQSQYEEYYIDLRGLRSVYKGTDQTSDRNGWLLLAGVGSEFNTYGTDARISARIYYK